ncbi:hypothetical protein CISG_06425 [Coccidioides immitis RMSCC 3703]|uniref:VOC domain-containing protein n=1 Tax=Coccidioides immitis RMSCC 3703 TaxID=454286 RepID=A0A0J8TWH2_COCIT|nr:hypothetical protein CISG_06425 [Coccidioides immitis RMSCC 3703]
MCATSRCQPNSTQTCFRHHPLLSWWDGQSNQKARSRVDMAYFSQDNVAGFALGTTTLLLFKLGGTDDDRTRPGGMIPKHGPTKPLSSVLMSARPSASDDLVPNLRQHFCFAVSDPGAVKLWDERLQKLGIKIRSRMDWQAGGKSVYFEDPDGHVGEIGSRGASGSLSFEED